MEDVGYTPGCKASRWNVVWPRVITLSGSRYQFDTRKDLQSKS